MFRLLTILLFCLTAHCASAQLQVDTKINAGSLITGGINLSADFMISRNVSLAAGLAYSTTRFGLGRSSNFRYKSARFIPEFRYYVSPEFGADRFFVGAYGKMGRVTAEQIDPRETSSGTRAALGVLLGYKWVSDGGVVIEVNTGVGRASTFSNDEVFDQAISIVSAIDFRLGILAGYRF